MGPRARPGNGTAAGITRTVDGSPAAGAAIPRTRSPGPAAATAHQPPRHFAGQPHRHRGGSGGGLAGLGTDPPGSTHRLRRRWTRRAPPAVAGPAVVRRRRRWPRPGDDRGHRGGRTRRHPDRHRCARHGGAAGDGAGAAPGHGRAAAAGLQGRPDGAQGRPAGPRRSAPVRDDPAADRGPAHARRGAAGGRAGDAGALSHAAATGLDRAPGGRHPGRAGQAARSHGGRRQGQ